LLIIRPSTPRFGWIKKGLDAAVKTEIFLQDDAPVRLDVGKTLSVPFATSVLLSRGCLSSKEHGCHFIYE